MIQWTIPAAVCEALSAASEYHAAMVAFDGRDRLVCAAYRSAVRHDREARGRLTSAQSDLFYLLMEAMP